VQTPIRLSGKLKLCFEGLAYDGVLEGCANFDEKALQAPFSTSIALKDIRLGKLDLQSLIGRHVEGSLDGSITYNGKNNLLIEGSGAADLRLSDGRLELLQPILSLDSIDFDQVSIKRKEIGNSRLDLRGTIEPFSDFFKSLPGTQDTVKLFKRRLKRGTLSFTIRGTLSEPSIQFT
jgi:hypothetical protein